jgi:hypothetical protein
MKGCLILLCLFLIKNSFGQELAFSEDGKKGSGFAEFDTIFKPTKTIQLKSSPFIFRHIAKNQKYFLVGLDTISLSSFDFDGSDSIEYFALMNTGNKLIKVTRQDWSLISVKEAINYKDQWMPIEFWSYSNCGNSYYDYTIFPGSILLFKTYKQFGSTNTKLRLRLKTSTNGIIISEPYEGNIDDTYFILNTKLEKFSPILKDRLNYLQN